MRRLTIIACGIVMMGFISCSSDVLEQPLDCTTSGLTLSSTAIEDADCNVDNGSISFSVTGGTEPYTYILNEGTPQSSPSFSNLGSGEYLYEIIDLNGCSIQGPIAVGNISGIGATTVVTESGCGEANGSIAVTPTGGATPYSFRLDGGASQTSGEFSNLAQGVYAVTVEDNDGCTTVVNASVRSGISYSTSVQQIIQSNCNLSGCHDGSNSLPNFTNFNELKASAGTVKSFTQSGFMPRGRTLTEAEKQAIACWVDDGALNN